MNSKNTMDSNSTKTILLTVDYEDWFQVENLRAVFPQSRWNSCELRVHKNMDALLDLFEQHNVRATFFVLGWLAERLPQVVRDIKTRGHEIASHGYGHNLCSDLSKDALHEDLYHSKAILEDLTGDRVIGYRAPSFSITNDLIEALANLDFKYDSSYNDFSYNKRYGRPDRPLQESSSGALTTENGIFEIPLSNLKFGKYIIPWAGGGYFRFWPTPVFEWGVRRILENNNCYVFYCHPWEIDLHQPRVRNLGMLNRFRHYLNLDKTLRKLDHFISSFNSCEFISCSEYLNVGQ
jgi:polysaccharide deacetylase family protein (PEP-CTERM system associated)